jgi:hypothetical protein
VRPSVARSVHFYDRDGDGPYAAIITGVSDKAGKEMLANLAIFDDFGKVRAMRLVPYSEADVPRKRDVWTWPPRVE